MTANEIETKSKVRRKEGFQKWLEQPATKMMMSMIPAGERQEVLLTLLEATYDTGFNAGSGDTAGIFLEALLNDRKPRS